MSAPDLTTRGNKMQAHTYSQTLVPGATWFRATMTAIASNGSKYPNDAEAGELSLVMNLVRATRAAGGELHTLEKLTRGADGALVHEPICVTCAEIGEGGFGPSHDGSRRCESGSIASGGTHTHCSCGICF